MHHVRIPLEHCRISHALLQNEAFSSLLSSSSTTLNESHTPSISTSIGSSTPTTPPSISQMNSDLYADDHAPNSPVKSKFMSTSDLLSQADFILQQHQQQISQNTIIHDTNYTINNSNIENGSLLDCIDSIPISLNATPQAHLINEPDQNNINSNNISGAQGISSSKAKSSSSWDEYLSQYQNKDSNKWTRIFIGTSWEHLSDMEKGRLLQPSSSSSDRNKRYTNHFDGDSFSNKFAWSLSDTFHSWVGWLISNNSSASSAMHLASQTPASYTTLNYASSIDDESVYNNFNSTTSSILSSSLFCYPSSLSSTLASVFCFPIQYFVASPSSSSTSLVVADTPLLLSNFSASDYTSNSSE